MRKHLFLLLIVSAMITVSPGCVSLKPVLTTKTESLSNYKYVLLTPTSTINSGSGITVGSQFIYTSTSTNPIDVIYGFLSKEKFSRIPELRPEVLNETLIVNYGETGRRMIPWRLGAYTIEVTIQFLSASTYKSVGSCTAEGIGNTEADDIRSAINRCLRSLFSETPETDAKPLEYYRYQPPRMRQM
jgi:hypothetical protein